MDEAIKEVRAMTDAFEKEQGRRPRIMIACMGQDSDDRSAKTYATAYADMGFDVDMGPLFQTPAEAAQDAIDNDVHIVDTSSLVAEQKNILPQLVAELEKLGREDIMVIAGGAIPVQDYGFLYENGVAAIYGPDLKIANCAADMMEKLNEIMADDE